MSRSSKISLLISPGLLAVAALLAVVVTSLFSPNQANGGQENSQHVQGIDVSHFQGVIKWPEVASDRYLFAIAKATGGETYVDPQFHSNWHGMRANGIIRGAYHFFYATDDAKKQAENYLTTVGSLKYTDLPPILDVEITDHTKASVLLDKVIVWLEIVAQRTHRTPIIYSDVYFAKAYLNDPRLSKYPLWIADYSSKPSELPSPWQKRGWALWQYSQKGKVKGIEGNVDMDEFNGDLKAFAAFIQQTGH